MPTLIDRLNAIGLKKGIDLAAPVKLEHMSLAEVLNAEIKENQFGRVLVIEKEYPYGTQHGNIQFYEEVDTQTIHKAGKVNSRISNLNRMVYLDTETTGLSGGTGTLAFLVGLARFTDKGLLLTQYMIEDPSEEESMLLEIANYCSDVDAVITFNGKSFDMPLLKTRYLIHKMKIPFENWEHLDLLHLSRRIWKLRLASRSLKDLEQEVLDVPRSEDEVPGWMIPEIYFNYLRTGEAEQLSRVVYHNAMDIVSLAALNFKIIQMFENNLLLNQNHSLDVFAIGQLYESIGDTEKAIEIYLHCLEFGQLEELIKNELRSRLAIIYKRKAWWKKALPYWIQNGNFGDYNACIELAKYYEHQEKSVTKALEWTIQGVIYLEESKLARHQKKMLQTSLVARKKRLEKRIQDAAKKNP